MFQYDGKLLLILMIAGAFCILYQVLMIYTHGIESFVHRDPLNKVLYFNISYWPITHFLLHMTLAYCFPQSVGLIVVMGILWEIFEWSAGKILEKTMDRQWIADNVHVTVQYADPTRIGSIKDLYFNLAGNLIGLMLSV